MTAPASIGICPATNAIPSCTTQGTYAAIAEGGGGSSMPSSRNRALISVSSMAGILPRPPRRGEPLLNADRVGLRLDLQHQAVDPADANLRPGRDRIAYAPSAPHRALHVHR